MKQRTLTSLGILAVLTLMFVSRLATIFLFDFLVAVMIILCAAEFSKMLAKMNKTNFLTMIGVYPSIGYFLIVFSVFRNHTVWQALLWQGILLVGLFAGMFLFAILAAKTTKEEMRLRKEKLLFPQFALKKAFNSILGMMYPSLPLLFLLMISSIDRFSGVPGAALFTKNNLSFLVLLIAFLIPMLSDTFAMLSGMMFKGPKLLPSISPKKTVSGFVGGTVFTVIILSVLFLVLNATNDFSAAFSALNLSVVHFALLALFGSLFCATGDLFESYLKRKAGIKDTGYLLPGHGGFLDRFDSQVFCAPFVFFFFLILLL